MNINIDCIPEGDGDEREEGGAGPDGRHAPLDITQVEVGRSLHECQ